MGKDTLHSPLAHATGDTIFGKREIDLRRRARAS
jgi:hypothetical protein